MWSIDFFLLTESSKIKVRKKVFFISLKRTKTVFEKKNWLSNIFENKSTFVFFYNDTYILLKYMLVVNSTFFVIFSVFVFRVMFCILLGPRSLCTWPSSDFDKIEGLITQNSSFWHTLNISFTDWRRRILSSICGW